MSCRLCGKEVDAATVLVENVCAICLEFVPISIEPLDPFVHSYEYSANRLPAITDTELFLKFHELFCHLLEAEAAGNGPLVQPTENLIFFNDMAILGNELGRRGFSFADLQNRVLGDGFDERCASVPCA